MRLLRAIKRRFTRDRDREVVEQLLDDIRKAHTSDVYPGVEEPPATVHELLDVVGVPRAGAGEPELSELARVNLMVTRYASHHERIIAANTALVTTLQDVRTLLNGAPNSGSLRIRRAISLITEAITPARR